MSTAKIIYSGELRTEMTHIKSGNTVITDAPTDNHGKGAAFSPTDLLSASLVSCMITIIGIKASNAGLTLGKISADMTKVMADSPRRVSEIKIYIQIEDLGYSEKEKDMILRAAINCPVAKSLHADINQQVEIHYV